jgi:hypothetical protein
MNQRASSNDPYSGAFDGAVEHQIGLYLEYGQAAVQCQAQNRSLLVHHEDLACDPASVITAMFALFDRHPEERVIRFVEQGRDKEIADRAPMHYRRLTISSDRSHLNSLDIWKIFHLTQTVRRSLGYSDPEMARHGFPESVDWPAGVAVPDRLIPLSGFHENAWQGLLMKEKATVLAYFSKCRDYRLFFEMESVFPEALGSHVQLEFFVSGQRIHGSQVLHGKRITKLEFSVCADTLHPIDSSGAYLFIELRSSHVYAPLAHVRGGSDYREQSFAIRQMKVVADHA